MNTLNPLTSIIIPVFNRAELIVSALESVLAQTYLDWECLVVDDGSTDGTQAVVKGFGEQDGRIRLLERPDSKIKGAPSCRNYGLEQAQGAFVWFFDSDDMLQPNALADRMQVVDEAPDLDFWVFQTQRFFKTVGDDSKIWNALNKAQELDLGDFLEVNPVWHTSGPIWRRNYLMESGLYYREGVLSWQDWEFHIRVLSERPKYIKFAALRPGVFQRFHDGEAINTTHSLAIIEDRLATLYELCTLLEARHMLHRKPQEQVSKTLYFLLQQLPKSVAVLPEWRRFSPFFKALPLLDVWFWGRYLHLQRHQGKRGNYKLYKFMQLCKGHYFCRRIAVDLFKPTWYKQIS